MAIVFTIRRFYSRFMKVYALIKRYKTLSLAILNRWIGNTRHHGSAWALEATREYGETHQPRDSRRKDTCCWYPCYSEVLVCKYSNPDVVHILLRDLSPPLVIVEDQNLPHRISFLHLFHNLASVLASTLTIYFQISAYGSTRR